jgi:hypothetical protein
MDCKLKEKGEWGCQDRWMDGGGRFEKGGDPKIVIVHQVQISGNNYNKSKLHS